MSLDRIYRCRCGSQRLQANHWFAVVISTGGLHFYHWEVAQDKDILDQERTIHLCGQVCAHKLLDEFLSGNL